MAELTTQVTVRSDVPATDRLRLLSHHDLWALDMATTLAIIRLHTLGRRKHHARLRVLRDLSWRLGAICTEAGIGSEEPPETR